MRNTGLEEAQAGIKIARRNTNNLRYAGDITLMAESKEELKSLLMKVKEESEKVGFKTQHSENEDQSIQSHHFIANRWGNNGNSERLFWGGSKITADGVCNHEIKRCLFLGREGPPGGSDGKTSACNVGDPGSVPGLGISPGEGNGNPLQYSCLENTMD